MVTTYNFPDENIPNKEKLSFSFGQKMASAIWASCQSDYMSNSQRIKKYEDLAKGEHDVIGCINNMAQGYKMKKHLQINPKDKVKILPELIRKFLNNVDYSDFATVVRAIDPEAISIKNNRKNNKLDLYYSRDFIREMADLNGGQSIIPLDQIPESIEQIEMEEETAKPLQIETAEELAIDGIARVNNFKEIQKRSLQNVLAQKKVITKVYTCPVEGIKIKEIPVQNFIHEKSNKRFLEDCRYFGEIVEITVAEFKNICAESNLKFSEEEIRKMARLSSIGELNNQSRIKVMFFEFLTTFEDVYKYKKDREKNSYSLINRTDDVGTEKEYNPQQKSDKSEKITYNYPCWMEGVMVLDAERTIVRYRKVGYQAEHNNSLLSQYIVWQPREIGIIEEVENKIMSIQELRFRIVDMRNKLRGTITKIDPDAIANITLDKQSIPALEVLSMYFTLDVAFEKTRDIEGDYIGRKTPLQEIPSAIPYALRELLTHYIQEIQSLHETFGYIGANQQSLDPKSANDFDRISLPDSTALRDYTDGLHELSTRIMQAVSSRINDLSDIPQLKDWLERIIGTDNVEIIERFRKDRKKHEFTVYAEYVQTRQEKLELKQNVFRWVDSGYIDYLDAQEILNIRNPKKQSYTLRLRTEAKKKEAQNAELEKINQASNGNVISAQISNEEKRKTLLLEEEIKERQEAKAFDRKMFSMVQQGEIDLEKSAFLAQSSFNKEEYRKQAELKIAEFKKQQDAKLRHDIQDKAAENTEKAIKLRRKEISSFNENNNSDVDLTQLQNTI